MKASLLPLCLIATLLSSCDTRVKVAPPETKSETSTTVVKPETEKKVETNTTVVKEKDK